MEQSEQFRKKPLGIWSPEDMEQFYRELDRRHALLSRSYVNPASGAPWEAVVDWPLWKDFPVPYMIEKGDLHFMICFDPEETENTGFDPDVVQQQWQALILSAASDEFPVIAEHGTNKGNYRTVAIISRDLWLGRDEELLNISRALNRLQSYTIRLTHIILSDQ